jgi:hypothetical protein
MGYSCFRAALIALLAWNTAIYLASGTASEALDSSAWLVLLLSFELETGREERRIGPRMALFARACRLGAAAALVAATIGYVGENEWLDAVNMGLWLAVVALLDFQVRYPGMAARWRAVFTAGAAVLYSALAALVLAWAWRGEWFDAYDALLWLIAFATIEMNIFRKIRLDPAPARAG